MIGLLRCSGGRRTALVLGLGLALLITAVGVVHAQAESPAGAAEAVAASEDAPAADAPAADAAAAEAAADEGGGSLYASPLWLLLVAVVAAFWLYVTSWVSGDAKSVGMDYPVIGSIMLASGTVGLVLTVLIHAAIAFVMLAMVLVAFSIYIVHRNQRVPEQHKYLGAHHRAEIVSRIPVINKIAAFQPRFQLGTDTLPLSNEDGMVLSDFTAEQPSLSRAAGLVTDIVLRAGAIGSPKARILAVGEQYMAQFLLDGMLQNVEAFTPEIGQQILGLVSQFTGLSAQGRMRQGSSSLYAELPGHGKTAIGVQIAASGGKPLLLLSFPDWNADLYKSGLEALGMHEAVVKRLRVALGQKSGTVLFCSDPGMGKTTTLYGAIGAIDIFTTDVFVVEHKEEHPLEQVRRWQIPRDQGFDQFFQVMLRESPNVIVLGDLEDADQARNLLQFGAQEGQCLTTIRSPDGPNGLAKLVQLVQDPKVVTASVTCVIGQRLVRKLCTNCREQVEPNPALLRKLDVDPGQPGTWYRPVGCEACLNAGYRGRIGMFSMLIVTDPVKRAIESGKATPADIRQAAGKTAFRTMYQDGISKVTAGVTTLDEVRRVLGANQQKNGS